MNFAALALLPAALLLDRLFGEPPNRIHPVCLMGALAGRIESLLRCGPNGMLLFLAGGLACLLTVLPCAAAAGGIVLTAQWYGGQRAGWYTYASRRAASPNMPSASPCLFCATILKARAEPYP